MSATDWMDENEIRIYENAYAEGAKAEREKICKELLGFVSGWGSLNFQIPKRYLKQRIESLRDGGK